LGIKRQALHCYDLRFYHPFTEELQEFKQPLAADLEAVVRRFEE
ncbi:RluA family pseudouridine synthase, partial [Enterococcus faecium]